MFKPMIKSSVEALSRKLYRASFRLIEPFSTKPKPLQFVNIWIPGIDEVPMSISNYEKDKYELSIVFKVIGPGTIGIRDKNGYFGLKGPIGKGFIPDRYSRLLYVAGGSGIAPLPLLARYCYDKGISVDVAWGVKHSDELFNVKTIAPWVNEVFYASEDCGIGYCGYVSNLVDKLLARKMTWDAVLAVGPREMLKKICSSGYKSHDIYVSIETIVKCGLGACGSCVLKPIPFLLCRDGPVFNCDEVVDHLELS
ncbi:MAG: dihydroorotate dehydrogenase [Desulfurococcaceae archaeon]